MMGQQAGANGQLFYSFNLDSHVPADHLLKRIDRVLDLSDLRRHLAPFYSHTGRPSVDPELMIRMLVIDYCYGIRSERRLCDELHVNLAYRGSVGSGWRMRCRIIRPFPGTATAASAIGLPSAGCSTR
jgi:transposase